MWCLFVIIPHGMTAVCYPWLFRSGLQESCVNGGMRMR